MRLNCIFLVAYMILSKLVRPVCHAVEIVCNSGRHQKPEVDKQNACQGAQSHSALAPVNN